MKFFAFLLYYSNFNSSMSEWIQLPWIINQISKNKFNSFNNSNKKLNKDTRFPDERKTTLKKSNPFLCLSKVVSNNAASARLSKCATILNQQFALQDKKVSLPQIKSAQHKTLPPILSSQSKGFIFWAFNEIERYLLSNKAVNTEQFQSQICNLKNIKEATFPQVVLILEGFRTRGVIFLDPVIGILAHCLEAEVRLKQQKWEEGLYHFRKAEFYARKIQLMIFATYCLVSESDIFRSCSKLDRGLRCLKNALNISIHINQKEIQLQILQKIGLFYYYSGNTPIGEYYHCLANQGLAQQAIQRHKKQYKASWQLAQLEQQLLSFSPLLKNDEDTNENELSTPEIIKPLVKTKQARKKDRELSIMLLRNFRLATTVSDTSFSHKQNIHPNSTLINTSLILKSHLSGNRRGVRGGRQWQWARLLDIIDKFSTL